MLNIAHSHSRLVYTRKTCAQFHKKPKLRRLIIPLSHLATLTAGAKKNPHLPFPLPPLKYSKRRSIFARFPGGPRNQASQREGKDPDSTKRRVRATYCCVMCTSKIYIGYGILHNREERQRRKFRSRNARIWRMLHIPVDIERQAGRQADYAYVQRAKFARACVCACVRMRESKIRARWRRAGYIWGFMRRVGALWKKLTLGWWNCWGTHII